MVGLALLPALFAASLALQAPAEGDHLATVPEASRYERTSSHQDVLSFLTRLQLAGASLQVETIGTTVEGRPIPLVILSDPPVTSPAQALRLERPIVYVQANIHAGEVEGKEAALMVLRDLTVRGQGEVLKHVVLLVVPDYNPDGNDRFGPAVRVRPGQNGPAEVGVRQSGQGFDLNRDCMKAESNEFRAILEHVLVPWDPDLCMDLHTTNGSYHGYPLTYAPPLLPLPAPNPGDMVRDHLLVTLRASMREHHGYELFDYGNFDQQEKPTRWETFDHLPRYFTNYIGLRGRMAVLSEAYSYAPFRTRIDATYHFVRSVLDYVAQHAGEVRAMNRAADARVLESLGVRFELEKRADAETVLVTETEPPPEGKRGRVPTERIRPTPMAVFDRFRVSREVAVPAGFLLPESMTQVVDLLGRHGIVVQRLTEEWKGSVQVFTPRSVQVNDRAFQGHNLTLLDGARKTEQRTFAKGSVFVSCRQPLGALAFYLLDPESDDGVIAWQLAGVTPQEGEPWPLVGALEAPKAMVRVTFAHP